MRRSKLELEIYEAVSECLAQSPGNPDVGLYISETDGTVLCVPHPAREAEALFDYLSYDWRDLIEGEKPSKPAIRRLVDTIFGVNVLGDLTDPISIEIASIPDYHSESYLLFWLIHENFGKNIIFSPLGVKIMLEMLLRGVAPDNELFSALDRLIKGFDSESVDDICSPGFTLHQASGIWTAWRLGLPKNAFKTAIQEKFGIVPQRTNFQDPEKAKAEIDSWADKHTNGLIKSINLNIDPLTLIVLANVLYLKAKWEMPFKPEDTQLRTFYNADDTTSSVKMMHLKTTQLSYQRTSLYQVVCLPYQDYDCSMTIVLPRKGKDINEVMANFNWLTIYPNHYIGVDLRLPKFKINTGLDLNGMLRQFGLADLFDSATSLTEITAEPVALSNVAQQCSLTVDEEGTEAAAVTYADVKGCLPDETKTRWHRMVVDRPFGFAITHRNAGILFTGIVNNLPDAEDIELRKSALLGQKLTSITVAGTSYIKDIDILVDDLHEGVELTLVRDIYNEHDSHAIALFLGDNRIGYVPRTCNEILANLLDGNIPLTAIITDATVHNRWLRLTADIHLRP